MNFASILSVALPMRLLTNSWASEAMLVILKDKNGQLGFIKI